MIGEGAEIEGTNAEPVSSVGRMVGVVWMLECVVNKEPVWELLTGEGAKTEERNP